MNLFLELLVFFVTLLYSYLEAFVKLFVPVRRKSLSGELVLITGAGHGSAERRLGTHFTFFFLQKVKKDIGDVTILVNNAGVITAADFLSTQDQQIERMFEVNILGQLGKAGGHFVRFLPSHLYFFHFCSSSKFAAVGFHRALTEELSTLGKDGIKTTCLCPVFINTGFVKNPRARLGKILEVEEVVEALMEGIVTNQKMVFVPPQLNMALLSEMVFPERALNTLKKLAIPTFDAVIGQRSTQ
uniref:Estradiol 17-beta-dehydrogenase 11 n=1 Tax=Malurus cyaneus samueli TaxID=2593467 RepID=A0A8C5X974_9PASS